MNWAASLLPTSLLALALASLVLLALTVQARVLRGRREASLAAVQGRFRPVLLELASGEDDTSAAREELMAASEAEWRDLRPAVVALLAKVRGRPAMDLAALLQGHGDVAQAREALTDPRPARRARAAYVLGLARDGESVDLLRGALADPSADVRIVAARSLGFIGDARAVPDLLVASGRLAGGGGEESSLPAWVAADALLRLGQGVQTTVTEAIAGPDPFVRSVAAQVAYHGGYPSALVMARTCVHFESEWDTKETLLRLIGKLGDESDAAVLATYASPLAPPRLRRAAVTALGDLSTGPALEALLGYLDDDDRSVAAAAGDALGASGARGVELLLGAQAQGGRARRAAAAALHLARLRSQAVAS